MKLRTLLLLTFLGFAFPAKADECINIDRSGWPERFKARSLAGAVSMIAGDEGVDPVLNPGINGGKVYQDGFNRVCLKWKNPAFDFQGKVNSLSLLQKMIDNEALNEQAESEIREKVRAFDALTDAEKVELIKSKLKEK